MSKSFIEENLVFDISIVGSGVKFPEHLTLETIAILEKCNSVYTIASYLANEQNTPPSLKSKIKNLWHLYQPDRLRRYNYKAMTEAIINAAYKESPIAYLASGNPVVFDSVTQWIIESAKEQNLTVKVFPSISSIDTIMVDLKYEVAPGLQIYDASMLIGLNLKPQINISCIILQISTFGTSYTTAYRIPKKDFLAPLKTYLMQFYPASHQVHLINSSFSNLQTERILSILLENMDALDFDDIRGCSLFIPPVYKPNKNLDFFDKMMDANNFTTNYLVDL
jgi:uncharacterized protein YabN with tetrapyrrole methylase and pyrophosphatase domain